MPTLRPFWQFLESRPRPVAVINEWRQRTGEAFETIRQFLSPTGQEALSYPHPGPDHAPLRIVHHRDGSIVAVSEDDDGVRLTLATTDLALFRLDLLVLRRALCGALGLVTSRETIDNRTNYTHIGSWEPKPAAAFGATLYRPTSPLHVKDCLRLSVPTSKEPRLIFTPTRDMWPEGTVEACRKYKCLLVPLDDVVAVSGSTLTATDKWPAYAAAFAHYVELSLPPSFSNKQPRRKRGERAAKIEAVRIELVEHIKAARKHAYFLIENDREPCSGPAACRDGLFGIRAEIEAASG